MAARKPPIKIALGPGMGIEISGPFFEYDPATTLNKNLARAVEKLGQVALDEVQSRIVTNRTARYSKRETGGRGYTRKHVELHRTGPYSLYRRVRMEPKLERQPGSSRNPAYAATRRPYIVAAILESGRYGGQHIRYSVTTKSGRRIRKTKTVGAVKRQRPLWMFRDAYRAVRSRATAIVESVNLVRGLT